MARRHPRHLVHPQVQHLGTGLNGATSYRLPPRPKQLITDLIALTVYCPLSRLASLAAATGLPVAFFPLNYYRNCSFYTMRTDARDRFGTPFEQRFSRAKISSMCTAAGLGDVRFSQLEPYWCVVGFKAG